MPRSKVTVLIVTTLPDNPGRRHRLAENLNSNVRLMSTSLLFGTEMAQLGGFAYSTTVDHEENWPSVDPAKHAIIEVWFDDVDVHSPSHVMVVDTNTVQSVLDKLQAADVSKCYRFVARKPVTEAEVISAITEISREGEN